MDSSGRSSGQLAYCAFIIRDAKNLHSESFSSLSKDTYEIYVTVMDEMTEHYNNVNFLVLI